MLDFLAYAIVLLVFAALVFEAYWLMRNTAERFMRAVGIVGLVLVGWSYYHVIIQHSVGMPTSTLRPGIFLVVAYIVSRNLYDFLRR